MGGAIAERAALVECDVGFRVGALPGHGRDQRVKVPRHAMELQHSKIAGGKAVDSLVALDRDV
tara:strand:+ start:383 stop:571 length:189 start_codon:yes stop_codon:yes gene_type:complete